MRGSIRGCIGLAILVCACHSDITDSSAPTLPRAPRFSCQDYYIQTNSSDCWLTALGPEMHGPIWDDVMRLALYSAGSLCYDLGATMNQMMSSWYQTDVAWPMRDENGNQEYDQYGNPKMAAGEYSWNSDEIHQARSVRVYDGTVVPLADSTIQFVARHEAAHRMFGNDESTANGVANSCAPGTETGGPGDPY